jgi:hypothetical protein
MPVITNENHLTVQYIQMVFSSGPLFKLECIPDPKGVILFFFFKDRGLLCTLGWPQTHMSLQFLIF